MIPLDDDDELYVHRALILIFHGSADEEYAHAACFVRKDYRNSKQILLLDCKNSTPIVYPKKYPLQVAYGDSVKYKEDIEGGVYHRWDIYAIE